MVFLGGVAVSYERGTPVVSAFRSNLPAGEVLGLRERILIELMTSDRKLKAS